MITFYANMIKRGQMTLERVPARWRAAVAAKLGIVTEEVTGNI